MIELKTEQNGDWVDRELEIKVNIKSSVKGSNEHGAIEEIELFNTAIEKLEKQFEKRLSQIHGIDFTPSVRTPIWT